jgi:hypothetical protein
MGPGSRCTSTFCSLSDLTKAATCLRRRASASVLHVAFGVKTRTFPPVSPLGATFVVGGDQLIWRAAFKASELTELKSDSMSSAHSSMLTSSCISTTLLHLLFGSCPLSM